MGQTESSSIHYLNIYCNRSGRFMVFCTQKRKQRFGMLFERLFKYKVDHFCPMYVKFFKKSEIGTPRQSPVWLTSKQLPDAFNNIQNQNIFSLNFTTVIVIQKLYAVTTSAGTYTFV